jgi:hypothetical protein
MADAPPPQTTAAGRLRGIIAQHPELAFLMPPAVAACGEVERLRQELADERQYVRNLRSALGIKVDCLPAGEVG